MKYIALCAAAACLQLAALQPASAKSPFCFAGSPVPKHHCAVAKYAAKQKHAAGTSASLASRPAQRNVAR
jgi:hypothetical protein